MTENPFRTGAMPTPAFGTVRGNKKRRTAVRIVIAALASLATIFAIRIATSV